MARHRWLTWLVVLVCRILSLGTIEAVTSEDNRIEVMRIPKTGSSSLGSHLMKKPECKERVRFHPNHPKSIERAYLQHHNETESSGTGPNGRGSAEELAKTNRPNWVPGMWNVGLSDSVRQTVTVVRHPCQRFGSLFAAIKGLDVSIVRQMDHPDQLLKWLIKRYAHLALDPWMMAKEMQRDEKTVLQNDSWVDPDNFEAGGRHLRGYPSTATGGYTLDEWERRHDRDRDRDRDRDLSGLNFSEAVAAGCDFASGCLTWAGGDDGTDGEARSKSQPGDIGLPEQQMASRLLLERRSLGALGGGDPLLRPLGRRGEPRRDRIRGAGVSPGPGRGRPRADRKVRITNS